MGTLVAAPWASIDDVRMCAPCASADDALLSVSLDVASDLLFTLSGSRWRGVAQSTVRPCCQNELRGAYRLASDLSVVVGPINLDGSGGGCGCRNQVILGASPIVDIVEVLVDAQVVPESAYRVDDFRYLIRTDGRGWPCCQDWDADPETDADTFQVTFRYGAAPPEAGRRAAAALACELAQACEGKPCSLPQRATQVTRQGVSAVLADPGAILDAGRTGVMLVDLFLMAVNPGGQRMQTSVASPDFGPAVRVQTSDYLS